MLQSSLQITISFIVVTNMRSSSCRRHKLSGFVLLFSTISFLLMHHLSFIGFKEAFTTVQTKFTQKSSSPLINTSFFGFLVETNGQFLDRVSEFNKALSLVRVHLLSQHRATENVTKIWNDVSTASALQLVWGADDNYLELLATHHRHILTVALPWHHQTNGSIQQPSIKWNSLTDFSNVLVQRYYQWTADNKLCTLIETPGAIKMKYDAIFNRSCERDQTSSASYPRSISPVFFYAKPINQNHYWPNNGNFYPPVFYTNTPQFVFYMHVHQNAVVDERGDVFSGNSALLLYLCRNSSAKPQSINVPRNVQHLPDYDEVITLAQMWGTGVFHRMVEVIPRIVPYIDFLVEHSQIRIQIPVGSGDDQLPELLGFLGLDKRRLIHGVVRGKIIYQPRPTGCGMANVQESQLTSKLYRDHIAHKFPDRNSTRNRLILIRRSGNRRFSEHRAIESQLKSLAADFGLIYELFPDNPIPPLADTMTLFNSAVMVVAPHGAGLSNMMFSEPGTFVVEGVCNVPRVNLCFQRLAHVLGHRWHGILSRGGCDRVVDVSAHSIIDAARAFLTTWNETEFNVLKNT